MLVEIGLDGALARPISIELQRLLHPRDNDRPVCGCEVGRALVVRVLRPTAQLDDLGAHESTSLLELIDQARATNNPIIGMVNE